MVCKGPLLYYLLNIEFNQKSPQTSLDTWPKIAPRSKPVSPFTISAALPLFPLTVSTLAPPADFAASAPSATTAALVAAG